jgi:hypothetical protein
VPSWFINPELDDNIPLEVHRFMVKRAGARAAVELAGVSHASPPRSPSRWPRSSSTPPARSADALEKTITGSWPGCARRVLDRFRSEFVGRASPVHFFWNAMDLAYTRFSGRDARQYPGGLPNCPPSVMLGGCSHEPVSFGFWPGGGADGTFSAYPYPEPLGYRERMINMTA